MCSRRVVLLPLVLFPCPCVCSYYTSIVFVSYFGCLCFASHVRLLELVDQRGGGTHTQSTNTTIGTQRHQQHRDRNRTKQTANTHIKRQVNTHATCYPDRAISSQPMLNQAQAWICNWSVELNLSQPPAPAPAPVPVPFHGCSLTSLPRTCAYFVYVPRCCCLLIHSCFSVLAMTKRRNDK